MTQEPTDADLLLRELQRAGPEGVHSGDIRRWGISGNPSQRVRELKDRGHEISSTRENRGKRPGVRYRLAAEEPAWSLTETLLSEATPGSERSTMYDAFSDWA